MVGQGGSDLHITTNSAPQIRVDGAPAPLSSTSRMTPSETKQLAYSILTDNQKHRLEEDLEIDFSFGIKGLARFRANVFHQRGAIAAAFRQIPFEIQRFNELGAARDHREAVREAARAHPGHRPDRLRQVDHARRHARQDQPRARRAHRSPSRTRSSSCTRTRSAWSTSARSTPTPTASPTPCAPPCARTPTWCSSARCATWRPSSRRCASPRPAT